MIVRASGGRNLTWDSAPGSQDWFTSLTIMPPRLWATNINGRSGTLSLHRANRRSLLWERILFWFVAPAAYLAILLSYPNIRTRESGHCFGSRSPGQNICANCAPFFVVSVAEANYVLSVGVAFDDFRRIWIATRWITLPRSCLPTTTGELAGDSCAPGTSRW